MTTKTAPTAEDFSKLESRYQKELAAVKGELKTERETNGARLSQLEDDLEAAQGAGGDEEVATAKKKLRSDQRQLASDRKDFEEESSGLTGQALDIAKGAAHTSAGVPLALLEGAETLEAVELVLKTYKAVKGDGGDDSPSGEGDEANENSDGEKKEPGYETGAGSRNQKDIGEIAVNGSSEDFEKVVAGVKKAAVDKALTV